MKKKTALISPILTHYRINFYKELNSAIDNNLICYFQNKNKNDGRPAIKIDGSDSLFNNYKNNQIRISSFNLKFSWDLILKIKREKVEVLIIEGATSNITSWVFLLFKEFLNLRIVVWACGWYPEGHSIFVKRIKTFAEKLFFSRANSIITYSTKAKLNFERLGINKPIYVAYNGIDLDTFKFDIEKVLFKSLELKNSSKKVFLYVGGIFEDKKVKFLIEAFNKFNFVNKDSILWVIGDGPMKNELELFVKNHNFQNILFLGRIEKDVDYYFSAADFFVLPGIGGLALNQAMLWKTPCIVSEADGTEDDLVIDEITGFRFIKNDMDSLVLKMGQAYNLSEQEYIKMGAKAQDLIIQRSNTDQMVKTFRKVIDLYSNQF
ncbi:glycosyltransferase family 4 protein [Algoriphagus sanaruensis]|uniref:Glycosyl transferase family 1 domain-containing protein n=1 Tax=Algoriphagus sanaruensis TaxID=1727163 RepID=A0A142EQW6_9BACT|nr:glycosyltransferase family 4 protein [Algoriphagus sanaruensis]AMQ57521.1 hypothetical protein AO498_13815 [Algoriphagus sanaruensis]